MRCVKVTIVRAGKYQGRTLIPEMWLVGACHRLEREGMNPKEALETAIARWIEQEEFAKAEGR